MCAVRAQYVSIPDSNFGKWLNSGLYNACMRGSSTLGWELDTTCFDLQAYNILNCSGANIYDLTGIKYITGVEYLACSNNHLTSMTEYPPALKELQCENNNIISLAALPVCLHGLFCDKNQLSSLPILPDSLLGLSCTYNRLTSLPHLPFKVSYLYCSNNLLAALPSSMPPNLYTIHCDTNLIRIIPDLPVGLSYLNCSNNLLDTLPPLPATLNELNCDNNLITQLPPLSANIQVLFCSNNRLTYLPTLNNGLSRVVCENNQLSTLPVMPASLNSMLCAHNLITRLPAFSSGISIFDCSYNLLDTIPSIPQSLQELNCSHNNITYLPSYVRYNHISVVCSYNHLSIMPDTFEVDGLICDHNLLTVLPMMPLSYLDCRVNPISCLPVAQSLQLPLGGFYIDSTNIHCLPQVVTVYSFDHDPSLMPLCVPGSGCDFYYNIAGNVHIDTSAFCSLDSLYPSSKLKNIKVQLKQNGQLQQQFYTVNSGYYSFKTDSLIAYEVSIDTTLLPLTLTCPVSGSRVVALSPLDSVYPFENFGMQCGTSDFGVLSVLTNRFRPSSLSLVHISAGDIAKLVYNAPCLTNTSGTLITMLSSNLSYINPAPGALTPTSVSGNTLTYNIADLNTLQAGSLDVILTTDANAAIGSQVCITTTITPSVPDANAVNNTLTQCYTVVNSYDPNIKEVYPSTINPSNTSEWLTYTVHFQNTGNDTAYTVVVRDTLSNNVQPETFQYLASSHHAVIQLFGQAMVFTFPKINLVDSATNPPLSEGWIQYKVKTKPNLPLTTQVKNTAYIYFDLNPAVVTNTAVSTVTITGIENVKDMGVVRLYPNPNKGSFTLESSITDGEYRIYDMMGALIAQHKINSERELVSLTDAAAGVYTLVVKNGTDSRAMRLMIER
jgi:uncharacterized repeat protein (TIGR01451 family)